MSAVPRRRFEAQEILAEHDYARPHEAAGMRLHGGFDAAGRYVSPRTRHRWEAVRAWQAALVERGWPLVEATTELLTEPPVPNEAQQRLLIEAGLGQSLWDSLTITGLIEARGRALAGYVPPDFGAIVREDVSEMGLGHLGKGLLAAHGWDEGGREDGAEGGHDAMWFAVRDLVFGPGRWPVPEAPATISRPVDEREMPELPPEHEALLSLLMNVLMIEVRAERTFSFYERVIGAEGLFDDRGGDRETALELIDRIRQDEAIHVAYLRTVISEFRSVTVETVDGERRTGAEIVDPVWERMVRWHAVGVHEANRPAQLAQLRERIRAHPDGEALLERFEKSGSGEIGVGVNIS